jgi:hypothetical protein
VRDCGHVATPHARFARAVTSIRAPRRYTRDARGSVRYGVRHALGTGAVGDAWFGREMYSERAGVSCRMRVGMLRVNGVQVGSEMWEISQWRGPGAWGPATCSHPVAGQRRRRSGCCSPLWVGVSGIARGNLWLNLKINQLKYDEVKNAEVLRDAVETNWNDEKIASKRYLLQKKPSSLCIDGTVSRSRHCLTQTFLRPF